MLVGLISDTHDNTFLVKKAAEIFRERGIKTLIHTGDVCASITLNYLKGFKIYLCLGNNDADIIPIKEKIDSFGGMFLNLGGTFLLDNKKFAIFHGHYKFIVDSMIKSQEFDYVIHGHTHQIRDEKIGRTHVINPGALYRAHNKSIAILDTEKDSVEFIKLEDCQDD